MDSARSGTVRMIGMRDLEAALREVRPSVGPWLETARNVALFANASGEYDDLLALPQEARSSREPGRSLWVERVSSSTSGASAEAAGIAARVHRE